jgi:hypothetical protein
MGKDRPKGGKPIACGSFSCSVTAGVGVDWLPTQAIRLFAEKSAAARFERLDDQNSHNIAVTTIIPEMRRSGSPSTEELRKGSS